MKRLRLIELCLSEAWGGMEMFFCRVTRELAHRHHVHALCLRGSTVHQRLETDQVRLTALGSARRFAPATISTIRRLVKTEGIHAIHAHASPDLFAAVVGAKGKQVAKVFLTRQTGLPGSKHDPFHRFLFRRVTKVFAVTHQMRGELLDRCPLREEQVVVIPNAIEIDRYDPAACTPGRFRKGLQVPREALLVGTVGRLDRQKGQGDLIRAARRVGERHPEVRFVIVGEETFGEEGIRGELESLATALGLSDMLFFAGFRKDIPAVLRDLDLFVLPSHSEAFGIALVEAMAMGLPTIGTDNLGVPEIINDGRTGLLVPPKDPPALAEAICRLIEDKGLRARLGAAARVEVCKRYSLAQHVETLEEYLTD